jgi:voltage-gated potassium channel Kch
MTISSYILKFTEYLYFRSAKVLGWLEKITLVRQDDFNFESTDKNSFEVVLFGRDRIGRIIENHLRRSETSYVVVDHNPEVIAKLEKEGIPFIFGSANNMESLNQIDFKKINIVFSTIPNIKDAEFLIGHIKKINPQCSFICATDSRREAEELYAAGAHYVIVTYMYAGIGLNPGVIGDAINLDHLLGKIKGFDVQAAGQRHRGKLRDEDFLSALS